MLHWLVQNLSTIVICVILAGVVALVIARMVKRRQAGTSSCGCGCASCAMHGSCHAEKNNAKKNAV